MNISSIFTIAGVAILAIFGLFIASRAVDAGMEVFGFVLVAFGVLQIFWLINRHFDRRADGSAAD